MRYLLLESHAAPLIGSSVIVHSGSAREDFATNGASHFLEHLLFNGTQTRTQEELYAAVDAIGGYNNATTRKTHVAYMMLTPAEKIRQGLEVQRDMLFHSTLPAEKLEKERGIILEELARDRDQGAYELERALDLAAFGAQGIGLPTLGSESTIRSMPRERILDFYHRFYVPQNMSLVVIGDFDAREMEGEIRDVFGAEPPGSQPVPPLSAEEPVWDREPRVAASKASTLVLEWTSPLPDPRAPGFLAQEFYVDLIAGSDAAPLNQAVRQRFPHVLSAAGRVEMLPGRSFFRYRIEAEPASDWRAIAEAVAEIVRSRLPRTGSRDLSAWKVARETEEYFLREKPHYYPIYRGDRIASQGIDGLLSLPSRLESLSPADLADLEIGWDETGFRLAVLLPEPDSPETSAEEAKNGGKRGAAKTERTVLDNGTELLVSSSSESPVLALHLFIKGRAEAEPEGNDGAVELLHRLMAVRTSRSDPRTLERRLRAIGAELKTADQPEIPYDDFYSTTEYSFVRLQTLDRYGAEAFALLAELIGPPAWTDAEFTAQKQAMLAQAERAASGSTAASRNMLRQALYAGTPRAHEVFGTPASIAALDAETLRVLARRYFVGRRLLLSVVTSLPPSEALALAQRSLGDLPAGEPPTGGSGSIGSIQERIRDGLRSPEGAPEALGLSLPESTLVRAKEVGAPQSRVVWVRPLGPVEAARLPVVEVWNAVLSNTIQFQLREREGLAYSLGSSVERLPDGTLLWVASAGTRKENLPRLVTGLDEQLAAALAGAPDSAEVRTQGVQLYGRSLMRRATRMNRAYAAGLAVLEGRDPEAIDEEIRAPMKVTSGEVASLLPELRRGSVGLLVVAY